MSKALVIRGADFSANAVAQVSIDLPYDKSIEYMQSDGTAFIKTGIIATGSIKFEVKINIENPSGSVTIIGSRIATNEGNLVPYYGYGSQASQKKWYWRYGAIFYDAAHNGATGDFILSNVDSAHILKVSGAASATMTGTASSFTGTEIYLFGWNLGTGVAQIEGSSSLKIKECKIYDGVTLVRNYIPVRIGTVGYLYDGVSRTLFANAAESGAFVLGPDK